MANRLFGQAGYAFREPFLTFVKDNYDAPFEPLDFAGNPANAMKHINHWVEDQTRQRIRDLIPGGALNDLTRLVLVNAIYLKAPWADEFSDSATRPQTFYLGANHLINVPMMTAQRSLSPIGLGARLCLKDQSQRVGRGYWRASSLERSPHQRSKRCSQNKALRRVPDTARAPIPQSC